MALMKTGRMTVKTTTKPVSSGKTTPAKKEDKYAGYSGIEKGFLRGDQQFSSVSRGFSKATPEQLEEVNKRHIASGGKLKYKEIRYDPNADVNKDGIMSFQGTFAHPERDKKFYETPAKVTPKAPVKTPEKVEVGKLPTRKLTQSTPKLTLMQPQKRTEMVPKAIEAPGGKSKSFKKQGSVTNRLKSQGGLAGGAEGRKYRKEEKLAGAYERTKALADENQGPRVVAGAFSKEKKAGYKTMRSDLRAARKETGVKVGSAIRDTRKAQKFEKKEQVGKTKYFTKSKLAETVKKTPSMKPVTQAGKTRYKK